MVATGTGKVDFGLIRPSVNLDDWFAIVNVFGIPLGLHWPRT